MKWRSAARKWNIVFIGRDQCGGISTLVEKAIARDLTNIIEVYDHNTPGDSPDDKSDDIIVLADRFWERFSLTAQIYSD